MNNIEDITNETLTYLLTKTDSIFYLFVKRFFDLLISSIVLLILLIPFFIIGLIIVLTRHHRPIYKDKRVGKDGKIINVYKFKTMVEDADDNPQKYLNRKQMKQWKAERKVDNDPRETKFGHILRKTSFDELPQFFNVFLGNMSLVGCRPITEYEFSKYFSKLEKSVVTKAKPGITGNWQVYSRSEATWESGERKKYMLSYIKNKSLRMDIKLFFLTIPACIKYFFQKSK